MHKVLSVYSPANWNFKIYFCFMCINVFPECVSMHHACELYVETRRGSRFPETTSCQLVTCHAGNQTQLFSNSNKYINCWAISPAPFPANHFTYIITDSSETDVPNFKDSHLNHTKEFLVKIQATPKWIHLDTKAYKNWTIFLCVIPDYYEGQENWGI